VPGIKFAIRCSLMSLLPLLLAACETIDETRVPAELLPIETTLEVEPQWSRSAGDGVGERYLKLAPTLVGNSLYVVDAQGTVSALKVADSEILWEVPLDVAVNAGLQRGGGMLFLGTEDGAVIALSQRNGRQLWREQLGSEVMALSDANLGVVVARTSDSQLYGLDVRSGEVLWQTGRTTPVLHLRGASEPVAQSGRVVVGFDNGKLVALSPVRGSVLWTTTIANPRGRSELERMVDIDGEIRVVDGIIYIASFRGRVAAVTLSDGRILWSRKMSSHMGLDVDRERVYVTDADGHVWALDRTSGATLWKQDELEYRELTAPVALDKYVIVGDFEGYLHWLSKYDGHFVARSHFDSAGILSTPLTAGETAYVLNRGGEVAALSIAAPKEKTAASQTKSAP
jgi:outer membrane protein assembly factor BamB